MRRHRRKDPRTKARMKEDDAIRQANAAIRRAEKALGPPPPPSKTPAIIARACGAVAGFVYVIGLVGWIYGQLMPGRYASARRFGEAYCDTALDCVASHAWWIFIATGIAAAITLVWVTALAVILMTIEWVRDGKISE